MKTLKILTLAILCVSQVARTEINQPTALDMAEILAKHQPITQAEAESIAETGALTEAQVIARAKNENFIILCKCCLENDLQGIKNLIKNDKIENINKIYAQSGFPKVGKSKDTGTPLHFACKHKGDNIDTIKYLIENGAKKSINMLNASDLNLKVDSRVTPFHLACENNKFEVVKYLVKNGAIITVKDISATSDPMLKKYLKANCKKTVKVCAKFK